MARWFRVSLVFFASLPSLGLLPFGLTPQAIAQPPVITCDNLKPWLESLRERYKVPSLGVAIIVDGRITIAATGRRKFDDPTPVTAEDIFHLGSCTKSMTAMLLAFLVQDGVVTWDSTLAGIFPELSAGMRPEYRAVTLRQLLEHRAGMTAETWPTNMSDCVWRVSPETLTAQRLVYAKTILSEAPLEPPGTKFLYSNRDYILAGAISERVTGRTWETLMHERVFAPLHMDSADFGTTSTKDKLNGVWSHYFRDGKLQAASGVDADNPAMAAPAGTVHCSLEDWAKYIVFTMQAVRGECTEIAPTNIAALYQPSYGATYAFGWKTLERDWGGGRVLTHNGTNTGNFCTAWLAPRRNFAILVVTNTGGGNAVCDEVAGTLVYQFGAKVG